MYRTRTIVAFLGLAGFVMPGAVGCQTDLTELLSKLESITININTNVNQLQDRDPRDPNFELPDGAEIDIDDGVDFITDPGDQLDPETLDDTLLIGFENLTENDIYVEYSVDDMPQAVYIFGGETVLLEYPCSNSFEVSYEYDYDPTTFESVGELDWSGTTFTNPEDFQCGNGAILSFDGVTVSTELEIIDLVNPDDSLDDGDDTDTDDFLDPGDDNEDNLDDEDDLSDPDSMI